MDEQTFRRSLQSFQFSSINRVWEFQSTKFRGRSVWRKPWQSVDDIRKRVAEHKQIFEDTALETDDTSPLCLLLATGNGTRQPFGLTRSLFEELIGDGRPARAFVRAVGFNTGCLGQLVHNVSGQPATISAIIATPYTPLQEYYLTLRLNVETGAVAAVLFCKHETDVPRMLRRLEEYFSESNATPLGILTLLIDNLGLKAEERRQTLDREVIRIERTTGMTSKALSLAVGAVNGTEYESLVRDIHACNTDLIFLSDSMNYELEFGNFCLELSGLLVDLREKARIQQPLYAMQATDTFIQDLGFLMNLARFRQNQTKALRLRVQGQINVLYSLISQRDSRLNYIIAEESRQIASAAQQDSRTMKTIAFMTLVFLPTTLVASVFSSGAFDLKAEASNGMVGSSWWILIVCSAFLTLIVMVAWWAWDKQPVWKQAASKADMEPAREQQRPE